MSADRRQLGSFAQSLIRSYIQRLDIKPVYTAVDRSQHPYSAQEAARDKQTRKSLHVCAQHCSIDCHHTHITSVSRAEWTQ